MSAPSEERLYEEILRGISIKYPSDWQKNESSLGSGIYRIQFISPDNNAILGIVTQRRQSSREEPTLEELLQELDRYMRQDLNALAQNPNAAVSQMPQTPRIGGYRRGVTITYQSNNTIPKVEQRLYTLNNEFYYTFAYSANSQTYWQTLLNMLSTAELLVIRPHEPRE